MTTIQHVYLFGYLKLFYDQTYKTTNINTLTLKK